MFLKLFSLHWFPFAFFSIPIYFWPLFHLFPVVFILRLLPTNHTQTKLYTFASYTAVSQKLCCINGGRGLRISSRDYFSRLYVFLNVDCREIIVSQSHLVYFQIYQIQHSTPMARQWVIQCGICIREYIMTFPSMPPSRRLPKIIWNISFEKAWELCFLYACLHALVTWKIVWHQRYADKKTFLIECS